VEKQSFEKGDDELKKMMSESMGGIGWWSVIFRSNFPTRWLLALEKLLLGHKPLPNTYHLDTHMILRNLNIKRLINGS
jgi:hypothetical protein